jgi:hypothetical protein
MKYLLLLLLAAMPLAAFTVNFVYCDYDGYDQPWIYEYWCDDYWYDGYWVYYPYGYYCVHFTWWYPWWWDWYWWRCHWCHHFHWDFFYAGFYTVWYEDGCWWFRPRYGRWVRYRVPYSYYTIRYNAGLQGIYLPEKPPREINVNYNQNQVMQLFKKNDPELYSRVEKEHASGNLEKMRQEYVSEVKDVVSKKHQEYINTQHRTTKDKATIDTKTDLPYTNTIKDHGEKDRDINVVNNSKPNPKTSTSSKTTTSKPAVSGKPVNSNKPEKEPTPLPVMKNRNDEKNNDNQPPVPANHQREYTSPSDKGLSTGNLNKAKRSR